MRSPTTRPSEPPRCQHCRQPLAQERPGSRWIADDASTQCEESPNGPDDDLGNVPHEPVTA